MRVGYTAMTLAVLGMLAGVASAGLIVGGTETFPEGTADWGVGDPDGWQAMHEENGGNFSEVAYGSIGTVTRNDWGHVGDTKGQPDPGSKTDDGSGTMLVQHLAGWDGGANDPVTHVDCGKQIQTITFNSVAGVEYTLTAWVNTTMILWNDPNGDPPWQPGIYPAGDELGGHPRTVWGMQSHFPAIEIGIKDGVADASDFTTSYTPVTGLLDTLTEADAWVQGEVTAIGTGGPMSIILKQIAPDISSGAHSDLDVRWDDITLTPEPTSLGLLGLGLMLIARRRRS